MSAHTSPQTTNGDHFNGVPPGGPSNGAPPISLEIPGGAGAPGRARRLTSHHLMHVDRTIASDAELIVSELVTNSVRHAGVESDRMVTLGLLLLDEHLRITVTDPGCDFEPRLLTENADGLGGHGLRLVAQLSASWGVGRDAVGATQVWCDLVLGPGRGRVH
ncbi:MAG: ATP-binding protein [Solirubrobacteraceae bacterium]